MDLLDPARRSALMGRIRAVDTRPEMAVRRAAHRAGYRFRLHAKDLPGRPDLVFRSRRKVVFVHGCFWHRHEGCRKASSPKTRVEFWSAKFVRNVERDEDVRRKLVAAGWKVLIVWECEAHDSEVLRMSLQDFLGPPGKADR